MTIETERLILRPFTERDVEDGFTPMWKTIICPVSTCVKNWVCAGRDCFRSSSLLSTIPTERRCMKIPVNMQF